MGREGSNHRSYDLQFKDAACKLVEQESYSVTEAANELGIPKQTLHNWLNRRKARAPMSKDVQVLQGRVRELEKQLKRAEMEKDILKKAAAYFASQGP
jgi:transposase